MTTRNHITTRNLMTGIFCTLLSSLAFTISQAKEPVKETNSMAAPAAKGNSSDKKMDRPNFGRRSNDPTYAQREDGLRYADIRNHSESGMVFAEFDSKDGFQAMETSLPDSFKRVSQAVWIPTTDNVALLVKTEEGSDIYLIECGIVTQITKTHDVIQMSVTNSGNSLSWKRASAPDYSIPTTYYAINTNNLTVTRQSGLNLRSVAKY